MEIQFVSTLTSEDEATLASGIVAAVGALLDKLPLAYTIRIRTSGGRRFDRTSVPQDPHPDRGRETDAWCPPAEPSSDLSELRATR
jgi:hypothetical protein